MEQLKQLLAEQGMFGNVLASLLLVAIILVLRWLFLRVVRGADWASEQMQLRWTVQVRWVSLLLLLLGLVMVWATELRTLALSVVAIAAAIVIATKELILCFSGSLVRATSGAYSVGDRIEIDGVRGDVVDIGAMTTTVLEVGPGHRRTGRSVVLPNALIFSKSVINETFTDDFVLHVINVPLAAGEDWHRAEEELLAAAKAACAPFLEKAREHMQASARQHGVPSFSVDPSVAVQIPEAGKINLALRVPAHGDQRSHLEQQILRRFLDADISDPTVTPAES